MGIEKTPLDFHLPDGKELVRDMDDVIAHNASRAESLLADARARLAQVELAGGFDSSLTVTDDAVAPLLLNRESATGRSLDLGVAGLLVDGSTDAGEALDTAVAGLVGDGGSGVGSALVEGLTGHADPLGAGLRRVLDRRPAAAYGHGVSVGHRRVEPGIDANYAAFPGATVLEDGRILLVWREGIDHVNSKGGIVRASTSADNGLTWTPAWTMLTMTGIDLRDPCLSTDPARTVVYLTYFKGTASTVASGYFIRRSTDQGATFGPEVRIDANQPYAAGAAPVVTLADGRLLATWYGKDASGDARESVYVGYSADGGLTWGSRAKLIDGVAAGTDMQEPYADVSGSTVVIMYRHGNAASIGVTRSANSGGTWSTPGPVFTGTGRPGFVITKARTVVVIYRSLSAPQHGLMRYSRDLGVTWSQPKLVERAAPQWWNYSAPIEVVRGQIFCPTTVELSSTKSKLTMRYLIEGGGVSPYGDAPTSGAEKVIDRAGTVAVVDDFERPDSATLGVSLNGAEWQSTGGATINDGSLLDTSGAVTAGNVHYANALTGDIEVEAELMWSGNSGLALIYRLQDTNNFCWVTIETVTGGVATSARIYKRIAGVNTQIGTTGAVTIPPNGWFKFKVVAVGDYHRLYFEDTLVASGTDSEFKTMPWVGLKTGTGAGTTTHRARNFLARRRSGIAS